MNTGLFDMFHDAANQYLLAIADSISIYFYSVIEETVQQDWRIVGHRHRRGEVAFQVSFIVNDFHCTATQYIGRTYNQWITDTCRFLYRHFDGSYCGVSRLFQFQTFNRLLETFTVFCTVNGIRAGTDNRYTRCFQSTSQFQWSLTTILYDDAFWLLNTYDFQYVFQCYWFEVQTVRRIEIGRYCFRVTVNHDGFETIFAQCQGSMYTAVIEFNTLTDTVWTTTQNHDFVTILVRIRFALFFIG